MKGAEQDTELLQNTAADLPNFNKAPRLTLYVHNTTSTTIANDNNSNNNNNNK